MKNLLTLLLLVLGTSAFANTDEQTAPVPSVYNNHEINAKKEAAKAVRLQESEPTAKQAQKENAAKERQHKTRTAKSCSTLDKSPFSISEYFVDFVHTSNVKLVNMILD